MLNSHAHDMHGWAYDGPFGPTVAVPRALHMRSVPAQPRGIRPVSSNDGLHEVLEVLRWAKTSSTSDATKIRVVMDAFDRCTEKVRTVREIDATPEGWILGAFLRAVKKTPSGDVIIIQQPLLNWSHAQAEALIQIEDMELRQ